MSTSQFVIVCQPAPDGTAQAPCGTLNGVAYSAQVVEQPVLSADTVAAVEAAAAPFDYVAAGEFWGTGFGLVLMFYLMGVGIGSVLRVLRV